MTTKVRSAITGHYVTKAYGDRHPKTTVTERDNPKPHGDGKRK